MNRDIAIIGMSCRFPDADNIDELFRNLSSGKDSLRNISPARVKATTLDPEADYRVCGYLEDIDKFDHAFFNISLGEAQTMDPHQRVILEVVHEAFDDAAYSPQKLAGQTVSVYVADTSLEYYKHADEYQPTLKTGNVKAFLGAWISKQFDLRGNVAMVDTSCSSALVAVHMACNELILGDADYAVACGVNLDLFPYADSGPGLNLDSPDGRSRPFSKKANGMSFGEGAACVLLKPYEKAIRDNDIIHAVIKGSAVNNNSSRAASLTAPDSITQSEVIGLAWQRAGIPAAEAGFIEAHGSGTQLGDSIEIGGLDIFFKANHVTRKTCAISTVKSNIGHTRSVAGMAGLIKAVLSLEHKILFPLIGFDEPSPLIDFENSPIYVVDSLRNWEKPSGIPRYAGVSSIGLSGTNCHVVLQENIPAARADAPDSSCLVPVSAKSATALKNNLEALLRHLGDHHSLSLRDIAYTLVEGRTHYPYRVALQAGSVAELREEIESRLSQGDLVKTNKPVNKVILIFCDHGQVPRQVIKYLSDHYPVFEKAYAACLHGRNAGLTEPAEFYDFAFQYSFYQLLRDNGLAAVELLSYGIGKILASVIKGEISLDEGLRSVDRYKPVLIKDLEARVEKLLTRVGHGESFLFVDPGFSGKISQAIRAAGGGNSATLLVPSPRVFDLSDAQGRDPLIALSGLLYECGQDPTRAKLAFLKGAKKISLPGYRFDRIRCWIREEPRSAATGDMSEHLTAEADGMYTAPTGSEQGSFIERKLLSYWKGILQKNRISSGDNFFDIGGDSLKATKLIVRINEDLGTQLDFEDVFDYPTITELAAMINGSLSLAGRIALFWKEVLRTEKIGSGDNFFDLGGHSLNATQVLNRIEGELHVSLNFEDFYKHPTPEGLTECVRERIGAVVTDDSAGGEGVAGDAGIGDASLRMPERIPEQDYYAVSHAQKRLWLSNGQKESSVVYNQPEAYLLNGELMITALQEAFGELIVRHESLRTTFHTIDGEPLQKIGEPGSSGFRMEVIDLRGESGAPCKEDLQNERIRQLFNENARTPFDFEEGPLLRVQLLVLDSRKYLLFINLHHIISDEWSFGILIREIVILYNAFRAGGKDPLPPLAIQYKDYCDWHNRLLEGGSMSAHRAYWLAQFSGQLPLLDFPANVKRPALRTYNGNRISINLEDGIGSGLASLAREQGASMFMTTLAIIKLMLYRYTGQTDIIIGCPVAGREHAALEGLIGFFINILPLRTRLREDASFGELLQIVKTNTLAGFAHQAYPFDMLVSDLALERNPSRSPLFDVGFTWHAAADKDPGSYMGLEISEYETNYYTAKTDLWFHGYMTGGLLTLAVDYNADIFGAEQIGDFMRHVQNAVAAVVKAPSCALNALVFLPEDESWRLLSAPNDTTTVYPADATIPQLFEEQVALNGERTAIVFKNITYTYKELNERSDRLARHLQRDYQVGNGDRVGLWVNRSELTIIGIFGILKAGAVYVPIDPEYPKERVKRILDDCGPKLLLTESALLSDLPEDLSVELMALDLWDGQGAEEADSDKRGGEGSPASSRDLAYIMYTSGSTGAPKGVCIEHRSVIRLVRNTNYVTIKPEDHLLQISSFAFDGSVFDIFGALLNGASLYLPDKESILSTQLFVQCIQDYRINMMFITTALFNNLIDTDPACISNFDKIFFGGERSSVMQINKALSYRKNRDSIVHVYGPTEGTTFSSYYVVTELGKDALSIPIGRPLANTTAFILDPFYRPAPMGVEGEIYLGGDGLARRYWNNETATSEKFVTVSINGKDERLYKTGDMGKWLPGGNIDFTGRRDKQVKIRGHRIELEEIENLLLDLPAVRSVYLRVMENQREEKELVAYFVPADGGQDGVPDLRGYLEKHIPLYMIPSSFIEVSSIPLNVNGKVDETALPDDTLHQGGNGYEAPGNDIEKELVNIWREQLGVERPGIRDNFFSLGGDSIKAIRLISAINSSFNKLLEVNDIFTYVDIASLATRIAENDDLIVYGKQIGRIRNELNALKQQVIRNPQYKSKLPVDYEDIYPMSDIEMGMVYHNLLDRSSGVYHDQLFYQFEDADFDEAGFKRCLELLVEKHELLRTALHLHGFNFPLQIVHQAPLKDPDILFLDLRHLNRNDQQEFLKEYMIRDRDVPFVFTSPGLWRGRIFRLADHEYGFLWVVHHAIIDGWSNASLITELSNLLLSLRYNKPLRADKLKASYKDFIIDQLHYERHSDWKTFWPGYLSDFKRMRLPLQNPGKQPRAGGRAEDSGAMLDPALSQALRKLSLDQQVSLREIFLASFVCLLKITTHSDDIILGLVTNARPGIEDGDKMIGCFLNTIPYRVKIPGRLSANELIRKTHALINELKPYEKISLQKIMEFLGPERLGGTAPLFNMVFGYLDFHIYNDIKERTGKEDQLVESYTNTNTDLDFVVSKTGDQFHVSVNYPGAVYEKEDVQRLIGYYKNILHYFAYSTDAPIENAHIIGKAEKTMLLEGFGNEDLTIINDRAIQAVFEAEAAANPDGEALIFEKGAMTYRELNELSNQLAHFLRSRHHVKKDQVVALMPDRSKWLVVGMLGILKSGACFMPMDPAIPHSRKQWMLADSGADILLTVGNDALSGGDAAGIQVLDISALPLADQPVTNPVSVNTSGDLAYILYTSGSTGNPKGTMIGHRNFVNMILYLKEKFAVDKRDNVLQFASVSFDASVYEIFLSLFSGAGLIMLPGQIIFDIDAFESFIQEKKASVALLPPVYLNKLHQDKLNTLRVLVTGGEEAIVKDAVYLSKRLDFYNAYGPTECAVIATVFKAGQDLAGKRSVPIGKPIGNTNIYILDEDGQLLPIGVEGEICISGAGVGRGYLNAPGLTDKKFVPDPFREGVKMFRTGDRGFYHKDGNIEFIGRSDEQIKINGYRMELEEIRIALMRNPDIKLALVMPVQDAAGEKSLDAYYHADEVIPVLRLRQHLEQFLPSYMIPTRFFRVEGFPLTGNGKVDLKKLVEAGESVVAGKLEFISPRNGIEASLAKVWGKVLRRDNISVYDNYFELGGTSVKLIEVFDILRKEYGYKVEIADFFKAHTIQLLSQLIEEKNGMLPSMENILEL